MHTSTQLVRFGQKQYGTYFSDQRYLFCHVKLIFLFESKHGRKLGCDQQIHCICDIIRLHRVKPISFPHQLCRLASRCFCFRHNCIICQSHTHKCQLIGEMRTPIAQALTLHPPTINNSFIDVTSCPASTLALFFFQKSGKCYKNLSSSTLTTHPFY